MENIQITNGKKAKSWFQRWKEAMSEQGVSYARFASATASMPD